jgi:hypothetical protein
MHFKQNESLYLHLVEDMNRNIFFKSNIIWHQCDPPIFETNGSKVKGGTTTDPA